MLSLISKNSNELIETREEIARSGEGIIYKTNKAGFLAKIYHSINQEKIEKLQVMVDNPPVDPTRTQNHISITWPKELLRDSYDKCLGFLMPEIKNGQTLINVYNPSLRHKKAPGFNWYYLHTTALNVALVIQALHHRKYVVGDLKPENLLVNERGLVSIIDTDSFQISDFRTGKVYYSPVTSQEYTPPEMFGKDVQAIKRSEEQDRFGLAVIIWLLLFGYHPFSGKWLGEENQPSIDELIRDGYWIYSFNSKISPNHLSIPLKILHPDLQKCFHKCFTDGHNNPSARPSATEWIAVLNTARKNLVCCSTYVGHYYTNNYGRCYWCERKEIIGFDIFLSIKSTSFSSNIDNINFSKTSLENQNLMSSTNHSVHSNLIQPKSHPNINKKYIIICLSVAVFIFFTTKINAIQIIENFVNILSNQTQPSRQSPEKFVRYYYSTTNNSQYKSAWNNLSPKFKNDIGYKYYAKKEKCKNTGNGDELCKAKWSNKFSQERQNISYKGYLDWWEKTVERVEINRVKTSKLVTNSATVDFTIHIYKDNTQKYHTLHLRHILTWDKISGKWVIDSSCHLNKDNKC